MAVSHSKRGINYEKAKSRQHGAKHVGGPGKHDYERGRVKGEVKCRSSKVTKPELIRSIKEKGIREFDSKAGFTQPAIDHANKYYPDVKLISRGAVIKRRK
ncbi:hypothetical protein [Methanocella arvoryzae]|uniref:hypothetical protein n=1 Tax=Methanocella arvoryzae TaxID=1175445 RepID=UPI0000DB19D5|nr:hypothetical protein [Methanocella arvoryzae]